jgi:S-DNA-T family DNA segregation ATPase FtsK/SpoIIIE
MTARVRSRPRAARSPRSRRRRGLFSLSFKRIPYRGVLAVAIGALAAAAILVAVDVPALLADARDGVLRAFGAGAFILAGLAVGGAIRARQLSRRDLKAFAQRALGATALGWFAWGALALNEANWTLGSVDFAQTTLGGEIGSALIAGFLGKLAWISAFIVGMALVAPAPTIAFARRAPLWAQEVWDRRWPHRVLTTTGHWLRFAFHRPGSNSTGEIVIGMSMLAPLPVSPALDEGPVIFRPSIDPTAPSSPLGLGAAATFAPPAATYVPAPEPKPEPTIAKADPGPLPFDIDEGPAEPQQLGFELETRSGWQLPALELLNEPKPAIHRKHDNAARAQLIVDTLASFGVDASVVEINEGPTVTQFGVEPGWEVKYRETQLRDENGRTIIGADNRPRVDRKEVSRTRVRVNKITTLANDLALALAAPSLRIEAPVPGRAIVGLEVPNDSATVVSLRAVMETKEFSELATKSRLAVALGKGVSGVPVVADLAKMPHLLIAGATGSGKSVCMNAIICGIMMNSTPDQVRFIMVDPKRVELTAYSGIPHMAFSEVIVDVDKVVGTLQAVVGEMDARYKKFQALGVRNIEGYNRHPRVLRKLPYWVVIIDELADLMMVAPFEVEKLLCRLAQLARATGIHLVVATQRPSVDVVTGLIKANFPTRIAFAVTSQTDSRTILDGGGAEKLLGRGDMLFAPTDASKPIRIQGVYVSDAEVERLVEFWKDERFSALAPESNDHLLEEALIRVNGDGDIAVAEDDPVIARARNLAMQHSRVSPSLFQRRLRVGYLKAARLIEILEEEGILGPREEGESRDVLVSTADSQVP